MYRSRRFCEHHADRRHVRRSEPTTAPNHADQRSPRSTVAVIEWMNRLELRVHQRRLHERRKHVVVHGGAQVGEKAVDLVRGGGTQSAPHGL